MDLTQEKIGDVAVVTVAAEYLDANNAREFKQQIADLIAGSPKLVLDLGNVLFMDSSGLGALLTCLRQLSGSGGDMKVCGVTKPVRALFELVRMNRILETYPSREDALKAFKG